jgi:hypothetical protein
MDYNGKYEPSCNFSVILRILLDARAIQYGINFDNSVEIHLTYRNSTSFQKKINLLRYNLSILYYKQIIISYI